MSRQEMIDTLISILTTKGAAMVMDGKITVEEVEEVAKKERARYENMPDLQLKNLIMINC